MTAFNQDNLNSLIRKNSFYVLSGKLVTPLITFFITIYIVRELPVAEYGIYNVLLAMMAYIGLLSSLGLVNIFQRYIPDFREKGEIANLKKLVTYGLILRVILVTLFMLCIIIFSNQTGKLFKIEGYFFYFKIFSCGILFFLEAQLIGIVLTFLFLHKYYVISQIIYTFVRAVVLFVLVEAGWKLTGLLLAEVIGFGILFGVQLYWYHQKFCKIHKERTITKFPVKRLLRFGGYSYFNEMGEEILDVSSDLLIISAFLGPELAGLYAFANRVMVLISKLMPHSLLIDVIRPAFFTRYSQKNDRNDLQKMFNLLTKLVAFISFPLVAGIFMLGDKIIMYIFDPKYLEAMEVLWIVAAFRAINSYGFPLGLVVQAVEKVEINLYSKIFSVYNLVGDLLVVNTFGITGVAIVTSSALLFKNLYVYLLLKKDMSLVIDFRSLFKIMINSILMAGFLFLFRGLIVNIFSLFLIVIIGCLIYFVISFLNKSFSSEERKMMNGIIPRPIFVF